MTELYLVHAPREGATPEGDLSLIINAMVPTEPSVADAVDNIKRPGTYSIVRVTIDVVGETKVGE